MSELEDYIERRFRERIEEEMAKYTCPRCDLMAIETRSDHVMCMICGDTPPDWPRRDEPLPSTPLRGLFASDAGSA